MATRAAGGGSRNRVKKRTRKKSGSTKRKVGKAKGRRRSARGPKR